MNNQRGTCSLLPAEQFQGSDVIHVKIGLQELIEQQESISATVAKQVKRLLSLIPEGEGRSVLPDLEIVEIQDDSNISFRELLEIMFPERGFETKNLEVAISPMHQGRLVYVGRERALCIVIKENTKHPHIRHIQDDSHVLEKTGVSKEEIERVVESQATAKDAAEKCAALFSEQMFVIE